VLVEHSPLSVPAVQQLRRAEQRSPDVVPHGAVAAVRRAASALTEAGATTMTMDELVREAAHQVGGYERNTLVRAVHEQARAARGMLTWVTTGAYRARRPGDLAGTARSQVATHVLTALRQLTAAGLTPASRRDIEAVLAANGLRYSTRAVSHGLTQLVRAANATVRRTSSGRYVLEP
jgi:hypothetical protein